MASDHDYALVDLPSAHQPPPTTRDDLHATYERSMAVIASLEQLLSQRLPPGPTGSHECPAATPLAGPLAAPLEYDPEDEDAAHAAERSSAPVSLSGGSPLLRRAGSLQRGRPGGGGSRTALMLPQVSVREGGSTGGGTPDGSQPGTPGGAAGAAPSAGRLPPLLHLSPLPSEPAAAAAIAARRGSLAGSSFRQNPAAQGRVSAAGSVGSLSGYASEDGSQPPLQQPPSWQGQGSGSGHAWAAGHAMRRPSLSMHRLPVQLRESESGGMPSPSTSLPGSVTPTPPPAHGGVAVPLQPPQHGSFRARRYSSFVADRAMGSTIGGGGGDALGGGAPSSLPAPCSTQTVQCSASTGASPNPSPRTSGSFRSLNVLVRPLPHPEPSNLGTSPSASSHLHAPMGSPTASAAMRPGGSMPTRGPSDRRMSLPSGHGVVPVVAAAGAAAAATASIYGGAGGGGGGGSFRRLRVVSEGGPQLVVAPQPQPPS